MTSATDIQAETQRSGWTGWIAFAGVMMILGGALHAFYGLVAALNDDWAGFAHVGDVLLGVQAWGWIAVIVGLLVVLCGFGVFSGNILARTVGVILAALSVVTNFAFIPVNPAWAVVVIVIDLLVIWALTAHGAEMRSPRGHR
jgi:hypothetical protein